MAARRSYVLVLVLSCALPSQGFLASCGLIGGAPMLRAQPRAVSGMKMGLFDAIGKAMNEAMANDQTLSKPVNPGFREGYDGPAQVTVNFLNSGIVVESYGGERLGDVARRAGEAVPYGCQKGTCGTCEVTLTTPEGTEQVRCCQAVVPKHELASVPEYQVTVPDPLTSRQRVLDWEQVRK
eukprot:CAMPEP_0196722376 /NCGR_PEP_ID=MMETSP1091-20130531/4745_1 /TAXON_ID=302021 /ORGANISM="Rhodomonas sp., Strain CCMP768" /LENGTH=180 /DNA_ID=CAMNT_0042064063 /DNA_START=32 /DNA_END=574 /DNA_ORIENTATION=-